MIAGIQFVARRDDLVFESLAFEIVEHRICCEPLTVV